MLMRALAVLLIAAASSGAATAADYGGPRVYGTRIVERETVVRPRKRVVVRHVHACPCLGLPWGGAYETWIDLPWGGLRSDCAPLRRAPRYVVMRKG